MNPEPSGPDCIFCKIASGEIPTAILYQDEDVFVFPDIKPATPVHLLVVSRRHIPSLAVIKDSEMPIVARMVKAANQVAREQGVAESGYRLVINSGPDAGQVVPHLHMHLMGGRKMGWLH